MYTCRVDGKEPQGKFELSSPTASPPPVKLKSALLQEADCKTVPSFLRSLINNGPVKVSLCSHEGTFQSISVTFVIMKKNLPDAECSDFYLKPWVVRHQAHRISSSNPDVSSAPVVSIELPFIETSTALTSYEV